MKYNYTEMKENEHSYDNFDLRMTNEVPAVYVSWLVYICICRFIIYVPKRNR